MATNPPKPPAGPPAELDEAAAARIAELEAEVARLREQAEQAEPKPAGDTRLAWVVTYPEISAQPKDENGEPKGKPRVLKQGETLPADCEWNAQFLRSIGHVTALQVAR
jgi:hypothetical protein